MTITTATTTTTTCPKWCESKNIDGQCEDGHDGPNWPSLPSDGGYHSVQTSAGMNEKGQFVVFVEAPGCDLTPEQALAAGTYLIEAAKWAQEHHA